MLRAVDVATGEARDETLCRCGWPACGCGAAGHGGPRFLIAATWVRCSGWRGVGSPGRPVSGSRLLPVPCQIWDSGRPGRDARCKRAHRGASRPASEVKDARRMSACLPECLCGTGGCVWAGPGGRGQRAVWPPGQKRGHVKPGTVSHAHMGTWRTTGGRRGRTNEATGVLRLLQCCARWTRVCRSRGAQFDLSVCLSVRPCLLSCRGWPGSGFVRSSPWDARPGGLPVPS